MSEGTSGDRPDVVYGPDDWRPLNEAPPPDLQLHGQHAAIMCAAIKDSGEPCRMRAIIGTPFCRAHGGTTIATQEQSRRRLDAVRSQLFNVLVDAAKEAVDTYVTVMREGKRDQDKLAAADRVLRMLGFDDTVSQVPAASSTPVTTLDTELADLFRRAAQDRLSRVLDVKGEEVTHIEPAAGEPSPVTPS